MICMDKRIRDMYEATKNPGFDLPPKDAELPVTWTKIFYKQYPRLPNVPLEPRRVDGEVEQLLKKRKSTREFERKQMSLDLVSDLLCKGVGINRREGRTYPSAGARYPVETYLAAFDVERLEPGIYHYDIRNRRLETLLQEDLSEKMSNFVSPFVEWAPAAFIFTSVISRSEVKYGVNAYRFSLIEAGHMVQNISLLAEKYGLGGCPIAGFVNDTVQEALDLTQEELPLYTYPFGFPKAAAQSKD